MGYWLRKNWLIVVTIISLTLNVIAAFVLYQDSKITVDNHEKNLIKAEPLDYETFKDQWGDAVLKDFQQVRGTYEDNSFVREIKDNIRKLQERIAAFQQKLSSM